MADFATLFDIAPLETPEARAVAHAYNLLRGGEVNQLRPTASQIALLRILADRRGLARAIKIVELERLLKSSPREIKSDVQDLRRLFRVRIGSSRDQHAGGYYLIVTAAEFWATVNPYLHQATSELSMVRAMCEPHELAELAGQLRLVTQQEDAHAA